MPSRPCRCDRAMPLMHTLHLQLTQTSEIPPRTGVECWRPWRLRKQWKNNSTLHDGCYNHMTSTETTAWQLPPSHQANTVEFDSRQPFCRWTTRHTCIISSAHSFSTTTDLAPTGCHGAKWLTTLEPAGDWLVTLCTRSGASQWNQQTARVQRDIYSLHRAAVAVMTINNTRWPLTRPYELLWPFLTI